MAIKSKPLVWIQLLIAAIAIAWFSYDFFHTVFNSLTYTLRLDGQFPLQGNAIAFFVAVAIKLIIFLFFIWLMRDCFNQLKSR